MPEPDLPPTSAIEPYRIAITPAGDGSHEVRHLAYGQRVMRGTAADVAALLRLLDAERDRMAAEILADLESGWLGDVSGVSELGDLPGDPNVYVAGGRSADGAHGDELGGWSDRKTEAHAESLLAHGLIGKGVEAVDPRDTAASESFTGFQNAAADAVSRWIAEGGLSAHAAPKP